jgi:hypothetical protein
MVWASTAAAQADPIAGATYNGVAEDGASVSFTVSPDGTIVSSYRMGMVSGDTCMFVGEGDKGVWEGAPIVNGAFEYRLYDAILFKGFFPGAQSAAGTFRFYNHASNAAPACDTGIVHWTATTTARPPTKPPPQSHPKPTFVTRVVLRKLSSTRVGGRLSSPNGACRPSRTVTLWRGPRRIASTRSKPDGSYSFPRSKLVRGHRVRASVSRRTLRSSVCAAGSSKFIPA